jgi:hypothetical protein
VLEAWLGIDAVYTGPLSSTILLQIITAEERKPLALEPSVTVMYLSVT